MFSDLVLKLFAVNVQSEDFAKMLVIKYARRVTPELNDEEILRVVYNFDSTYSFENALQNALRAKDIKLNKPSFAQAHGDV